MATVRLPVSMMTSLALHAGSFAAYFYATQPGPAARGRGYAQGPESPAGPGARGEAPAGRPAGDDLGAQRADARAYRPRAGHEAPRGGRAVPAGAPEPEDRRHAARGEPQRRA